MCACIEQQIVGIPVLAEIRSTNQTPTGRESENPRITNPHIIIHVPNPCLEHPRIVEQVIRMFIAVEIRNANQLPSAKERWSPPTANARIVIQSQTHVCRVFGL